MNWISNPFKSTRPTGSKSITQNGMYHEKQVKELCAVHALNNLFQESFYSKSILDSICVELSPDNFINPHRSMFGRGNYNVNIIMRAVQLKSHETIWFDKRKPVTSLNLKEITGFILNIPSDFKIAGILPLPWERKHWVAITKIQNEYYNLDSKLAMPELIGDEAQLVAYLEHIAKSKDNEIILVVPKEVELSGTWKL